MKTTYSLPTVFVVAAAVATITSSCRITSGVVNDSKKSGGVSKVADVKVNLPSADQFKPSQGSAVVNALQLTVKPKDSNCSGATQINAAIIPYNTPTLSEKFHKGCDYILTLAIGEKSAAGVFKAYYLSSETAVTASALEVIPVNIAINLSLTPDGQAAGMPASLSINPPTPSNPPVTPPNNGLAALAPQIAVDLKQISGGQTKTVPLASLFTTEYLVIDYSQPGCGPCMNHATLMNKPAYAERFSGKGKCTSIVMIENPQLGAWQNIYKESTYVGSHSFSYSKGNLDSFSSLFGGNGITNTPTFMIVDRAGKLIASNEGTEPKEVDSLCK